MGQELVQMLQRRRGKKKKKQEGAAEVFELLILGTQLSHPKKASEGVRACSPISLV